MAQDAKAPSVQMAVTEPAPAINRLGRERVSEIQRSRMLLAMAEVACERGAGNVSVAHVVERAGVSRRTFYEIFEDREDCFLAAFEEAIARADRYMPDAIYSTARWAERVREALEAMLRFLDDEPLLGRVAVVESLGAGPKALELRGSLLVRMVAAVDAGREESEVRSSATMLTAEGVVGGVSSVVHGRLVAGSRGRLVKLVNPLMSMIVLPYLGPTAARDEMERPAAKISVRTPTATPNPLQGLDMRLTYRTVRVLSAIAANPSASNRVIGEASGIGDQGQISKLLARLERLELIENGRAGPSKGAPNVWILTKHGEEVTDVIATRATCS